MRVRFWGVRGSIPAPGASTARYGGNTPCVEIRAADRVLIADAGTGIRALGDALLRERAGAPVEAHVFIGHTHWDHIQGLPFFAPLYRPESLITLYGVHGTTRPFRDVIAGQMASAYFPVRPEELPSKPAFVELRGPLEIGPVRVTYHYLNHPGITVGYRFEHAGVSVCYLSDHEPYAKLNARGEFTDKEDAAVARFAEGADLLICESQYTADEYRLRRGWGHSTFEDVLDLADRAKAKRLALFHHDPTHDDDAMDAHAASCAKAAAARGGGLQVLAAREGLEIEL
jgi:phosphoribosyl 1,2-cyclic phosphodiesterase